MIQKKQHPSEADLLKSIRDADRWKSIFEVEDKLDDSWITLEQIQKIIGLKPTQTKARIKQKIQEGVIQKKQIKAEVNGHRTLKNFYKIII